jgi:nitroreductase
MLEAARLSPSGGNEQPWAFGVITDCALIKQISKLAH